MRETEKDGENAPRNGGTHLNFQNVTFEISAGVSGQLPKADLPEIVFSGKSNVGKSSLINKLVNRKALARVSATPGKTATINFFRLPEARLVDLPGYGYAKVSQSEKKRWSELMEGYFAAGRPIAAVVQILDYRHAPTEEDQNMLRFLIENDIPFLVVGTKVDKLNKTNRQKQKEWFENYFSEVPITVLPFSAQSGEGLAQLKEMLEKACAEVAAAQDAAAGIEKA